MSKLQLARAEVSLEISHLNENTKGFVQFHTYYLERTDGLFGYAFLSNIKNLLKNVNNRY